MKSQSQRAGALVLPALAFVWFALIVVGNTFGHSYFVDGVTRQAGSEMIILSPGPTLAAAG